MMRYSRLCKGKIVRKKASILPLTATSLYYVTSVEKDDVFCVRTSPGGLLEYTYAFDKDEVEIVPVLPLIKSQYIAQQLDNKEKIISIRFSISSSILLTKQFPLINFYDKKGNRTICMIDPDSAKLTYQITKGGHSKSAIQIKFIKLVQQL